jgi:hypothetical protein
MRLLIDLRVLARNSDSFSARSLLGDGCHAALGQKTGDEANDENAKKGQTRRSTAKAAGQKTPHSTARE